MYISPKQYPELQGRGVSERIRIMANALATHDKTCRRRFFSVVGLLLVGAVLAGGLNKWLDWPKWMSFAIPLALLLLLYGYLLWEINGPFRAALKKTRMGNMEHEVDGHV